MVAAAATRLRALTWLVPVKITPFWFTTSTVPSALIEPWISLGLADAPTTRFSAASEAFCLNCSVVSRPTLSVSQLRMARDCVCSMVTTCRPSATLFAAPWRLPIGLRALGCPQAARRQPIRHAGAVGRCRRARRPARLRGHRRRRAVQVVERALQLLARLRLLLCGVTDARHAAVRQAARALHRLRRALVGEPTGLKARDCACAAPRRRRSAAPRSPARPESSANPLARPCMRRRRPAPAVGFVVALPVSRARIIAFPCSNRACSPPRARQTDGKAPTGTLSQIIHDSSTTRLAVGQARAIGVAYQFSASAICASEMRACTRRLRCSFISTRWPRR